jgi:hypothetical protein
VIATNTGLRDQFNQAWTSIGNYLSREQLAITTSIPIQTTVTASANFLDYDSFVKNIETYSLATQPNEIEPVLRAIADPNSSGGINLVQAIIEAQNAHLLDLVGIPLNNSIDNQTPVASASAVAQVVNGTITSISLTSGGAGYTEASCNCCSPTVTISDPTGMGAVAAVTADMVTGQITAIRVISGGTGYTNPTVTIPGPVAPTTTVGGPVVPGSFLGNDTTLVPSNLHRV